jgi:group II intron reverse transcriptase/maturase
MTISLSSFTQMARDNPKMKFTSLMGMVFNVDGLLDSFDRLPAQKAAGVDGMQKDVYAVGKEGRIADLSARLRRMGYRPKPSLRVYIPKANGGVRPLGIPSFEDKIVQDRLSQILQAIWEPEFRECSYGYRPNRGAHDALRRVAEIITNVSTQWVVEADIKGFFTNVCHEHLMKFLEYRISDPCFLRTIRRFLIAGVMEDGQFSPSDEGTPQGGLVSPVLANIYLHYVLDWWFEGAYAQTCRGRASMVRFADDFVCCFQDEDDAKRFMSTMTERLAQFGLEVEPSKTKLIRFGSHAQRDCGKDGRRRPATFSFLGLTHYVGTSRTGRFVVGRKTEGKRMGKKLKELGLKLQRLRQEGGKAMLTYVRQHLQGHFNYYGVSGNSRSINVYGYHAAKVLLKWLNRRSQRPSVTWELFYQLLREGLLPKPRIIHNLYPKPLWMT